MSKWKWLYQLSEPEQQIRPAVVTLRTGAICRTQKAAVQTNRSRCLDTWRKRFFDQVLSALPYEGTCTALFCRTVPRNFSFSLYSIPQEFLWQRTSSHCIIIMDAARVVDDIDNIVSFDVIPASMLWLCSHNYYEYNHMLRAATFVWYLLLIVSFLGRRLLIASNFL